MLQTGDVTMDSAVDAIQSGVDVWNTISSGQSANDQGWGHDS
jgi:hypothetical protein